MVGTRLLPRPAFCVAFACLVFGATYACGLPSATEFASGALSNGGPVEAGSELASSPPVTGATTTAEAGADAASDPAAEYAATVRADGPIAYWRFDEAPSAKLATDELDQHPATPRGSVVFGVPGLAGHGVALDGTQAFDVGDVFDFAGKVPFALELWVQTSQSGDDQHLVRKRTDGSNPLLGYILYLASDLTAHFEAWGVGMSAWTNAPIPQTFTHVVLSVDYTDGKGNATLWTNGTRAPNGGYDNVDDLADTNAVLQLGGTLKGTMDEVAFYDHALSAERIVAHYQAGLGALRPE